MLTTPFVRLLHISDLHFSSRDLPKDIDDRHDLERPELPLGEPRDVLFRSVLRDYLRDFKEAEWPKAILVSGDLVEKGGTDGDEFGRARTFLIALAGDLHIPLKRVFVVPGNHDVTWTRGLDDRQKFEAYLKTVTDFTSPRLHGDTLMPEITTDLSNISDIEVELALLVTPTYSGVADPFGKKLEVHLREKLTDLPPEQLKSIIATVLDAHRTLDVAALGTDQRRHIREAPTSPNAIRIALMHHHLLPHPQIDATIFEAVVDAGQTLGMLTKKGYDLVLHGHKHTPHLAHYRNEHGLIHVYAGASLFQDHKTGFAFIDIFGTNGAHDLQLTPFTIHYPARHLQEEKPHAMDRDGRVLDSVQSLAAQVPRDLQERVLLPLLSNLKKVLDWRNEYPDKEMFERLWEQTSFDISSIGARRLTFRSRYVDDQIESLIRVIDQSEARYIHLVSDDDLQFWSAAERENTPAWEYRMALKDFSGPKSRILLVSSRLWTSSRDQAYEAELNHVVEQMIGDGFEVAIVNAKKVPPNTARDFGIYGRMAVGLFDHREGLTRQLTTLFSTDDLKEHDHDWGTLLGLRDWVSQKPGEFAKFLKALPIR